MFLVDFCINQSFTSHNRILSILSVVECEILSRIIISFRFGFVWIWDLVLEVLLTLYYGFSLINVHSFDTQIGLVMVLLYLGDDFRPSEVLVDLSEVPISVSFFWVLKSVILQVSGPEDIELIFLWFHWV